MSGRASLSLGIALATFIALCAIGFSEQVVADTTCAEGGIAITDATRVIATWAGIPTSVSCWDPNNPNTGEGVGQAKQYLYSLLKTSSQCITPQQQITGLNSSFALCAERFLQAYQQQYNTTVTILRAYNTVQCEAALCVNNPGCGGYENNPAPQSNHTKGYAMDVSVTQGVNSSQQQQLINFAKQNPQYGVCFPISWDKDHMVLAGIPGSERCPAPDTPCSGSNFNPNEAPPSYQSSVSAVAQNPTGGVLGATQNPLVASTPLTSTSNPFATPLTTQLAATQPTQLCTPQYMCSNGSLTYETSSCTTQVVQTCQYGCSGTMCATAPAQSASSSSALLGQTSSVNSAPVGTVMQLPSSNMIAQSGTQSATTSSSSVIMTIVTGDSTFPENSSNSTVPQSSLSPLQQLLQNLSTLLRSLLAYL